MRIAWQAYLYIHTHIYIYTIYIHTHMYRPISGQVTFEISPSCPMRIAWQAYIYIYSYTVYTNTHTHTHPHILWATHLWDFALVSDEDYLAGLFIYTYIYIYVLNIGLTPTRHRVVDTIHTHIYIHTYRYTRTNGQKSPLRSRPRVRWGSPGRHPSSYCRRARCRRPRRSPAWCPSRWRQRPGSPKRDSNIYI